MATAINSGGASTSTSTKNKGGTIKSNGSAPAGSFQNKSTAGGNLGFGGSVVYDGLDADKTNSAAAFAFSNQRPVAKKTSSTIAGISNTVLISGAGVPGQIRAVNKIQSLKTRKFTTAIRANKYNAFTNAFDGGFPATSTDDLVSDVYGTGVVVDVAATPSLAVPGKIVFANGKIGVYKNYSSKST